MPIIPIKDCGSKGVNKDLLPSELELGWWSDCSNFRFANGFAEKFEGLSTSIAASVSPYWVNGYSTITDLYTVYAGLTKAYVYAPTTVTTTEITRFSDAIVISSITRVGTTATLTTTTNHGRTTGDTVTVYGALPSQYNVTGTITVTGVTTFTYTMASDPGASASPVGAYSYNVTSNFTGTAYDRITGGVLNGSLILNHPVDGLYYWDGDVTHRFRKFPASYIASVGRPFKTFVVQLGKTISGVRYPHRVSWSSSAEPGAIPASFDSTSTNDAGEVDLAETYGEMVDCLPLGDVNIIYKQDVRYAMQYVGGNDVFRFTKLPGQDGLFGRGCVVDTPLGHVFLTQGLDVKIHQGGEAKSIAVGRIKNWLKTTITSTVGYRKLAFLASYPAKSEVWICFPAQSTVGCDKIAVWNWEADSWGIFDIPSRPLTGAFTGLFRAASAALTDPINSMLLCAPDNSSPAIGILDGTSFGTTYFGTTVTATLERTGLHFDNRNLFKSIHRSQWNIDAIGSGTKTATITHGSAKTADGTVTYSAGATYTVGTTYFVNDRATSGVFGAIKLSTTSNLAVRSIDLDVTNGGTR